MKRIVGLLLIVCFSVATNAQQYDAQWFLGFNSCLVDFRDSNFVTIDTAPTSVYFTYTSASICDENGIFLFYTNGICVAGINGTLINGDGLSPCSYTTAYTVDGLNIPQATLFLPKPGDSRYYYLIHFSNDTLNNERPGTLYYSIIDKEANGGIGAVIEKNLQIIKGTAFRGGGMTACKHANGRDFWLVMGASVVNQFYKFLITPDSIFGPYIQSIGPDFPRPEDIAYSKFTQDGSKYATSIINGPIVVMDFDRCSGQFSNPINIYHSASSVVNANPINGCASLEFSPSSRFLYLNNENDLTQYDLWSGNIQDSFELYHGDSTDLYGLRLMQLATNGKLYACTWNGGFAALHLVNSPDLKGDSANFVYGGQPTLSLNTINVPNMINYKLGPLVGSGCDTILSLNSTLSNKNLLRIQPNPADKYVYVEMGMQGNYEFELLNETGQVLDKKETRQVDIFDTEKLSSGVYFIKVTDRKSSNVLATQKLVVAH